ncbi:MAG: dTMP kinase [Bacteroidota bacterium]
MFISFEGIDGSGKSTQIAMLKRRLEDAGRTVVTVREPGGTPLSEHVRALLLDPALDIAPFAELLLFSAARAQLTERVIRPALGEGTIVIADRFFDSTGAYQGAGRAVAEPDWVRQFSERVTGGLVPDRTYWLDLPLAESIERRGHRAADRMEQAGADFFARVAEAYARFAQAEPTRFHQIDATLPPERIHTQIWTDLQSLKPS